MKNIAKYGQDPLSLDVLVGDSEDTVFADLVVDGGFDLRPLVLMTEDEILSMNLSPGGPSGDGETD